MHVNYLICFTIELIYEFLDSNDVYIIHHIYYEYKLFGWHFFISWNIPPKISQCFINLPLWWIGLEFGCHEAVIVHFTRTSVPILLLSRTENLAWKSFFIRSSRTFSCMITKRRCMKNIWWTLKYMLASNSSITMHKVFLTFWKLSLRVFGIPQKWGVYSGREM